MTTPHLPTLPVIEWHGCYAESWKGWIVPAAFEHPAKFARGLIRRILEHGIERGYWQPGDLIGDPFGGVACGGVVASSMGFPWIGNELEPKFVGIGQQNIELHRDWYEQMNRPRPVLTMGDSRRFHEIIGEAVDDPANIGHLSGGVTSPPYSTITAGAGGLNHLPAEEGQQGGRTKGASQDTDGRYGDDPGQIAKLRAGDVAGVVTSPPFLATEGGCKPKMGGTIDESMMKRHNATAEERYGDDGAQIGNLKAGAIDASVTSPPWEKNCEGGRAAGKLADPLASKRGNGASDEAVLAQAERDKQKTYGESEGQIGREAGETYWSAMRKVYASLFLAIRPGGYAAIVVKDYVKDKQRVRLCDDTLRLLIHVGFEGVERCHAMLVEHHTSDDLFAGTVTKKKERKSFFRRLAEKKGSPPIDYEEVLIVRRPCA